MTTLSEPIWVALPNTGRLIDVAPLFNVCSVIDATPQLKQTDGLRNVIRRTIRTLNVAHHDPEFIRQIDLINLYADLHRLEDMFDAMQERPGVD